MVQRFAVPLLRSGETLERRINNMVRNADRDWYAKDDFYRLSILYAFGEHLAWIRVVERRFGFVPVEAMPRGKFFTRRLNGIFRALTSHAYFRAEDSENVIASAIPRLMLAAIGEAMAAEDGEKVLEFTEFATRYVNDAQFCRWFAGLDDFLRRAKPGASLSWDRLIIAGAELRALLGFLDPKARMVRRLPLANLDLLRTPGVAPQVISELAPWAKPPEDRPRIADEVPGASGVRPAWPSGLPDVPKDGG